MPLSPFFDNPYRPKNPYGTVTEDDRNSVLEMAKGAASSGLELFSDVLDTFGGRAIRGYLGGKPRELLSVIPLSDYTGLTNETEKVSGLDLAKQYNLTTGNDWADAGIGLGIDLLTDPTSYLFGPGRALTTGGRIAEAAGLLPRSLRARAAGGLGSEIIKEAGPLGKETLEAVLGGAASALPGSSIARAQGAAKGLGLDLASSLEGPLGGLMGIGLPLAKDPWFTLGTGGWANKAAQYAGAGADWLGMTLPARGLRAVFNKDVEGRLSQPLQEALLRNADKMRAARFAGEQYGFDIARALEEAGANNATGYQTLGDMLEGVVPMKPVPFSATGPIHPLAQRIRRDLNYMQAMEQASGINSKAIENYLPRSKAFIEHTPGFEDTIGGLASSQGVTPVSPHLLAREDIFRDLPGARNTVNAIARDPRISSPYRTLQPTGGGTRTPMAANNLAAESDIIRREFMGWTPAETTELGALQLQKSSGQPMTDAALARLDVLQKRFDQAEGLANWASRLDPKYAGLNEAQQVVSKPLPFYDPDVVKALANRKARSEATRLRADGIMHAVGKDAVLGVDAPLDYIPVSEVFQKVGLTGSGAEHSLAHMMQSLGTFTGTTDLEKLRISPSLAKDLTNYVTLWSRPTALDPFVKAWDSAQALFKAGIMAVWPKKYIRDFTQGAFQNFTAMNPAEFARFQVDATRFIRHGGVIPYANEIPGLERLSAEKATKALADEFASLDGFYTGRFTRYAEESGGKGFTPKTMPDKGREGILEILTPDKNRNTTWDVRDIAGVGGRQESRFAPVVAGGKISELIDSTNKFALFLQRRMNGYSAPAAWEDVLKRHYDFGNLTGTERAVFRRVVPFYSWMRQNVPNTVRRLIDNPGGAEALTAKALTAQRQEGFIPEFAGEGLAIPIGEEVAGTQRFLGKAGLPFEDALKFFGDIGNTKLLGNLTPALKIPMELATGTQLHTGRPLEDLRSNTGSRLLDEVLANSPISRAITTFRPFTDERKGIGTALFNALAPATVTDVEMEKQRERAVRDVIEQQLKGSNGVMDFERFYVKPENIPNLSEDQKRLLRVYSDMERKGKEESRKKRIGVTGKSRHRDSISAYSAD